MKHMYIRHTVGGKLFLDSKKDNLSYDIQAVNGIWKFSITVSDMSIVEQILQYRHELNIFVIEDNANQKSWYYSTEGHVDYDDAHHQLMILADFKKEYGT